MNEALSTSGRACHVVGKDQDASRLEHGKYLLKESLLVGGVMQRHRTSDGIEASVYELVRPIGGKVQPPVAKDQ